MASLAELLAESIDVPALVVLIIFIPFFALFTVRVARGFGVKLRPIRAYAQMRELVSQSAETGMRIQMNLGRGRMGSDTTPDTLAGLYALDYVARHAGQYGQPVTSVTGDGGTFALARGIPANARHDVAIPPHKGGACFAGSDPFAYAAGAGRQASQEPLLAQVLVGKHGAEGLLVSESSRQPQSRSLGTAPDLATAALLKATLDDVVLGEDTYAVGAYLGRRLHLGSLVAQDLLRIVVILAMIVGVVLTSLGYWG